MDPPYGLGNKEPTPEEILAYLQGADLDTGGDFMGKDWEIPSVLVWCELYRVLKPGAHVLCFGGTRTFDLISMGARMAGFERRDSIAELHPALMWMHGQGFPKSLNVGKEIDKKAGAEREVVGTKRGKGGENLNKLSRPDGGDNEEARGLGAYGVGAKQVDVDIPVTAPATDEAREWEGYGTALKPSWEPILVFRKALEGTVVETVLQHRTGALNIDGCRVKHSSPEDFAKHKEMVDRIKEKGGSMADSWKNSSDLSGASEVTSAGRWPPNATLTHASGCRPLGPQKVKAAAPTGQPCGDEARVRGVYAEGDPNSFVGNGSRVHYVSEDGTETVEAWECVEGCPVRALDEQTGDRPSTLTGRADPSARHDNPGDNHGKSTFGGGNSQVYADSGGASRFFPQFEGQEPVEVPFFYTAKATKKEATLDGRIENNHPTKKPLKLMQWLVRLVCPKGGLLIDPYCGSGTTLHAAIEERIRFTGIERDLEWVEVARKRVEIITEEAGARQGQEDLFELAMRMGEG